MKTPTAERRMAVLIERLKLKIPKTISIEGKTYTLFDMWNSARQATIAIDKAKKEGWNVRTKVRVRHGEAHVWLLYRRRQ